MASTTGVPTDRATAIRRLIQAFVTADVETTDELVTANVSGWSPALHVSSRQELDQALTNRNSAFDDVDLHVDNVLVAPERAVAEWRVSAAFVSPLDLDGTPLPATGERVHLAGATFCEFDGVKVSSFRHYFDDAALLEQLLGLT
jgi:predicted ester cyclase